MFCWKAVKSRLRSPFYTHNHPRLFDRGIRTQQSRAYGSNFSPLDMLRHDCQPVWFDYFDAVIQEKNPRIVCLLYRKIFHSGIIRLARETDGTIWKMRGKSQRARKLIAVNDHDLIIRITCSVRKALDASLKQRQAMAG